MLARFFKKGNKLTSKSLNESHLKNLVVLAHADGNVAEIEEHLLTSVAKRLGFDDNDVNNIKKDIDNIDFVLPEKYEDRVDQFNDLLTLMSIDGVIDPEEEQICREIAEKYELMDSLVDEMISVFRLQEA